MNTVDRIAGALALVCGLVVFFLLGILYQRGDPVPECQALANQIKVESQMLTACDKLQSCSFHSADLLSVKTKVTQFQAKCPDTSPKLVIPLELTPAGKPGLPS